MKPGWSHARSIAGWLSLNEEASLPRRYHYKWYRLLLQSIVQQNGIEYNGSNCQGAGKTQAEAKSEERDENRQYKEGYV